MGVHLGTSAHETPDAASLALGLWTRAFVYFVYFVVPQMPGCGPAACGAEVVACCLGEVKGSHARCLSAAKGWNHETHEIHEKGNLLVPADRVRGPESSRAVHGARFP